MPPKTQREREAEQRKAKLETIREQVDAGSLTIRQMTDEERERFEKVRRARKDAAGARGHGRRGHSAPRPKPPVPKT